MDRTKADGEHDIVAIIDLLTFSVSRRRFRRRIGAMSSVAGCFLAVLIGCLSILVGWGNAAAASEAPASSSNSTTASDEAEAARLAQLSLQELMNVRVTSVSKRDQSVADSAAAIFVLTQNDIHRSGVTTLADALRLVPGMHVAKQSQYEWAVSARGFSDIFANKLLVMIDGRSVYTPLFSGTYWQFQDTMLEDVDRIEIIRGPGATLWGANAVNGVINVITKSAKDTQGGLLTAGGGIQETGFGSIRYGGKLSEDAYYRIYGKFFDRDSSRLSNGDIADDRWKMTRGGFRTDWEPSSQNSLTLQGDAYTGTLDLTTQAADRTQLSLPLLTVYEPSRATGANLLGRWRHQQNDKAELSLQTYVDYTSLDSTTVSERRTTFDADIQQRFQLADRHEVTLGGEYRISSDHLSDSFEATFDPLSRSLQLFSIFLQDEITLIPDTLQLTLGSKFEHHPFTGWELQPSARILWTPNKKNSIWASVSRAVRTPSRAEHDIRLNFVTDPAPLVYSILGNPDLRSEELIAYELGYRVQPTERLSVDTTFYLNHYDRLRITPFFFSGLDPTIPGALNVLALRMFNQSQGEVYGSEIAVTWQVTDYWRLRPSYSFLSMQLHRDLGVGDASDEAEEGHSPVHQASVMSSVDLPAHVEWDTMIRYVDRLATRQVPGYVALDMRLAWKPKPWMELSIIGQNILDNQHLEFTATTFPSLRSEVPRSVFGKVTIRF